MQWCLNTTLQWSLVWQTFNTKLIAFLNFVRMCPCVCVRACVRARVRVCVCVKGASYRHIPCTNSVSVPNLTQPFVLSTALHEPSPHTAALCSTSTCQQNVSNFEFRTGVCQRTRRTYLPDGPNFAGTTPAPFDDRWHRGALVVVADVTQRCRDRVQTHVKAVTWAGGQDAMLVGLLTAPGTVNFRSLKYCPGVTQNSLTLQSPVVTICTARFIHFGVGIFF